MPAGIVKWFSKKRGYGFIISTAIPGQDILVHYRDIEGKGYKNLEKGEQVTFEISTSHRGFRAVNVLRATSGMSIKVHDARKLLL